jgi:hypothetical protein
MSKDSWAAARAAAEKRAGLGDAPDDDDVLSADALREIYGDHADGVAAQLDQMARNEAAAILAALPHDLEQARAAAWQRLEAEDSE